MYIAQSSPNIPCPATFIVSDFWWTRVAKIKLNPVQIMITEYEDFGKKLAYFGTKFEIIHL